MHIHDTVERVCAPARTGGCVVARDTHTCVLDNCSCMAGEQLEEIVRLHPNVSVVVKATPSGFLVVFTDVPHVHVLQSSDFAVLLLAGLCFVAVASLLG